MRRPRRLSGDELYPSLAGQGMISVDCESWDPELKQKGPGWHRDDTYVAGVGIGTEAGFRRYYPVEHGPDGRDPDNLDPDQTFGWLAHELKTDVPKVGANLGYDIGYLYEYGVKLGGIPYDVQNAEPLLDENKFSYSLESLSKQYLGIGKIDEELEAYIKATFGKEARTNPKRFIAKCPAHIVAPYGIGDINHPLEIFKKQKPLLERQNLWDLFILESKLIPLLHRMRRRAVAVDLDRAERMRDKLRAEQLIARAEMRRIVGFDVEVWAAASLARAFDQLGVRYPRTPKTDKPSFTKPSMERLALLGGNEGRFTALVLEDRRLDKMCGTFLEGCILNAHVNGRVYCQFNQQKSDDGGAVSGRFSSSNPNLQFIPERTEEGKLIRSAFIPDPGCDWAKPDYSQIEFRLMVHDAAELNLPGAAEIVQQYHDDPDTDFHEVVAEIVYGEEFTDVQRKRGKTINFGIAFGEGKDKLSTQLDLAINEAMAIINEYHRQVPFMSKLAEGASKLAAMQGEIVTLLGRIRRFPWGKTKWNDDGTNTVTIFPHRVPGARRVFTHKALNARIQGSAADIMKKAMVDLDADGVFDVIGVPHLTVHDELDFSMPRTRAGLEAMRHVRHVMENVLRLRVPLKVDIESGRSWGEVKKWVNNMPVNWPARRRAA
jgi:DNA polymerase-1